MKTHLALLALAATVVSASAQQKIPNELIDYPAFRKIVVDSADARESKRLTEEKFLAALAEPDVVLLDARSTSMFSLRHIKGAVNIPFTDFTAETLAQAIPSKTTKILIYCNNNFLGDQQSFASKSAPASLNLSTQASLRAYGYENIYELGPLLEIGKTAIPFAGSSVR